MFDRRSKASPSTSTPAQPPLSNPNPSETEANADEDILTTPDTSTPGLRHLIPGEVADDGTRFTGRNGSISLENLFNFSASHWVNLYDESASRHLAEELELCELLNRDAATEDGAEVDVDEMTGDILTS